MPIPPEQDIPIVDATLPAGLVAHVQTQQPVVNGVTCKINTAIIDTTRITTDLTTQQMKTLFTDTHNVLP
jgi:hypothetical protein